MRIGMHVQAPAPLERGILQYLQGWAADYMAPESCSCWCAALTWHILFGEFPWNIKFSNTSAKRSASSDDLKWTKRYPRFKFNFLGVCFVTCLLCGVLVKLYLSMKPMEFMASVRMCSGNLHGIPEIITVTPSWMISPLSCFAWIAWIISNAECRPTSDAERQAWQNLKTAGTCSTW